MIFLPRMHQNDLENIVPFFFLGLMFCMSNGSYLRVYYSKWIFRLFFCGRVGMSVCHYFCIQVTIRPSLPLSILNIKVFKYLTIIAIIATSDLTIIAIIATSDLTIIAIIATGRKRYTKVEHYIFGSSLCCIQTGRRSLKILGTIIQRSADFSKMLEYLPAKISMFTVFIYYTFMVMGSNWSCLPLHPLISLCICTEIDSCGKSTSFYITFSALRSAWALEIECPMI